MLKLLFFIFVIVTVLIDISVMYKLTYNLDRLESNLVDLEMLYTKSQQTMREIADLRQQNVTYFP